MLDVNGQIPQRIYYKKKKNYNATKLREAENDYFIALLGFQAKHSVSVPHLPI